MKIALIVNFDKNGAHSCAEDIIDLILSLGGEVLMGDNILCNKYKEIKTYDNHFDLVSSCDVVLTVGGDGTIIHSARHAVDLKKPVLGINMGRLGYVAELEANEVDMLKSIFSGNYTVEERLALSVEIESKDSDKPKQKYIAINDAVVSRGALSRIIDLSVHIDGEEAVTYRADGLIVSTPTGSTAYALSAGGPVVSPTLRSICLVPVCPHSMSSRCVVLSSESFIKINSTAPEGNSFLTIDGQISVELSKDDSVNINCCENPIKMIVLKKRNFLKLASEKLKEV